MTTAPDETTPAHKVHARHWHEWASVLGAPEDRPFVFRCGQRWQSIGPITAAGSWEWDESFPTFAEAIAHAHTMASRRLAS